jgi:hypothetical protein
MASIPGAMLLCASSPYARRGALWTAYRKHFGKPGSVLVWKADTRTMNPTISQEFIDEAVEADPASAAAEYGAEFRTDVETYVPREVVDAVTISGRFELPPALGEHYIAFVDPSGGSSDSMTLAIAHFDGKNGLAVLDCLRERRPPFSPEEVVAEFVQLLRSYHVGKIVGDRYGGEWVSEAFSKASHSARYEASELSKSEIYRELLPLLNSKRVELLDNARLVAQLTSLERRTARGGRDSIDHPPGQHDDLVNAAAGALVSAASGPGEMKISDAALATVRAMGERGAWQPALNLGDYPW